MTVQTDKHYPQSTDCAIVETTYAEHIFSAAARTSVSCRQYLKDSPQSAPLRQGWGSIVEPINIYGWVTIYSAGKTVRSVIMSPTIWSMLFKCCDIPGLWENQRVAPTTPPKGGLAIMSRITKARPNRCGA
jgi:hypothetical protein